MKVSIRELDDPEDVRELYELALPGCSMPGDDHQWWIARAEDGTVAGFCSAVYRPEQGYVFLSSAAVAAAFQGIGLQRRLIRVRVRWARRMGAKQVLTYTVLKNYPSMQNLLRCGFRFWEPPEGWAWVGPNVHYFRREFP